MKLYSIEGNRQHLDGGAMFGNAPKAMWEKWVTPDAANCIELATRALLVQIDEEQNGGPKGEDPQKTQKTRKNRNILFEVGVGAFFDPVHKKRYGITPDDHVLLKNLAAIGVSEDEIDAVVLSHLHFDHAGGLLPAFTEGSSLNSENNENKGLKNEQKLHFPNAKYYVSRSHWEYAKRPHPREHASFIPELYGLLERSGRLVLIDGAEHPDFKGIATFRFSDGHTKGLMLSCIETESGPLIFVTDLIPGAAWVHLPIAMGYDRYAELKIDEKLAFYQEMIAKNGKLFFTHDPKVVCGLLKQDQKGKYFVEKSEAQNGSGQTRFFSF